MSILKLLANKNYISYNKKIAKIIGIDEAILFGELCSLYDYFGENEFYCEQPKLIEDTCLTEYRVRNALKNLCEFGLLNIEKKGMPAKNYYTLNENRLLELIECQRTSGDKFGTTRSGDFDTTISDNFNSTLNKNISNKNISNKNELIKKENKKEKSIDVIDKKEMLFNEFWKAYPRKVNKNGAKKSFMRISKLEQLFPTIMEKLEMFKKTKNWQDNNGQYIPYPQTWINQKRWEDEMENPNNIFDSIDMSRWY